MNNAARMNVRSHLKLGIGGIAENEDSGVWSGGLGWPLQLVVREGFSAPGTSEFYGNMVAPPLLNDANQGLFVTPLESADNDGVWFIDGITISLVTRTGNIAPGIIGSIPFVDLRGSALNAAGELAFLGLLQTGGDINSFNDHGIWGRRDGGGLQLIVRESDHAPGLPTGAGIGGAFNVTMNTDGRVAFRSTLQSRPGMGASGITSNNNDSIWVERSTGQMQLVAREDAQPPGTSAGIEFSVLNDPAINAHGQVAFYATLRGTGVDATNDNGIWAEDASGVLHLIAREGDQFDVDPSAGTDLRTISQVFFVGNSGNEEGRRSAFNEHGQLAFMAAFTNGTAGIFVSDLVRVFLAGDYNHNGFVDAADYTTWRNTFGQSVAVGTGADGTGPSGAPDGLVDGLDYDFWKSHYGGANGSGAMLPAIDFNVPEPASQTLMLIAACTALLLCRLRCCAR
jgi:hypothetical protein